MRAFVWRWTALCAVLTVGGALMTLVGWLAATVVQLNVRRGGAGSCWARYGMQRDPGPHVCVVALEGHKALAIRYAGMTLIGHSWLLATV